MNGCRIARGGFAVLAAMASAAQAQQLMWTQDREEFAGNYGSGLSCIEDWSGDGRADVVIGAYGASCINSGDGDIELRDGATGASRLLHWCGDRDGVGSIVVSVKDVDGDGKEDVVTVAPYFDDPAGSYQQGRVVLISSATGLPIWELIGEFDGDHLGSEIVRLGDVNGDGYDEVLVSAPPQGTLVS